MGFGWTRGISTSWVVRGRRRSALALALHPVVRGRAAVAQSLRQVGRAGKGSCRALVSDLEVLWLLSERGRRGVLTSPAPEWLRQRLQFS